MKGWQKRCQPFFLSIHAGFRAFWSKIRKTVLPWMSKQQTVAKSVTAGFPPEFSDGNPAIFVRENSRQMNCSAKKGQLQRNHPRSRIELQRGWIWIWQEAIPISNSTMKKWSRCIRKATAVEKSEKSLDLQKNRSKNVWGGQGAKPGKNRKVFQNDVGNQQSKYQLHCQR